MVNLFVLAALCLIDGTELCKRERVQSAFQEKVPAGGRRLWCGSGGKFTGGWTKGLLLVENSMTHQRVTLLHTD
jgi:hypothetical protein